MSPGNAWHSRQALARCAVCEKRTTSRAGATVADSNRTRLAPAWHRAQSGAARVVHGREVARAGGLTHLLVAGRAVNEARARVSRVVEAVEVDRRLAHDPRLAAPDRARRRAAVRLGVAAAALRARDVRGEE